ncbi:hypothetical protein PCASD_22001 [Puccinia coronata f. sp. avenae]|uniref:Uncharacterized protein n=1 Tax=Puccinia coronata f. sp. avenae TaxID=200324 RepID=A0A2N5SLK0_9BASI|nr:hypothetical protein PCASD_22001 [Puccinia coronata f. sp. avenae]
MSDMPSGWGFLSGDSKSGLEGSLENHVDLIHKTHEFYPPNNANQPELTEDTALNNYHQPQPREHTQESNTNHLEIQRETNRNDANQAGLGKEAKGILLTVENPTEIDPRNNKNARKHLDHAFQITHFLPEDSNSSNLYFANLHILLASTLKLGIKYEDKTFFARREPGQWEAGKTVEAEA